MSDSAARASRFWAAFFSAMTVMLAWKYVSPWAAWGYTIFLLVGALFFDFGFEVRRGR